MAIVEQQKIVEQQETEAPTTMRVKKRNGSYEPVNYEKIRLRVGRAALRPTPLRMVDIHRVASKTIGGLYDGVSTEELDNLNIQQAVLLSSEEPEYSKLAARLFKTSVEEEVSLQGIHCYSESIEAGYKLGLISQRTAQFVKDNARQLDGAIGDNHDDLFEYFGLKTLYDRYLLRHRDPDRDIDKVIEMPQYCFMRVACGLAQTADEALELYRLLSSFEYMTSSPTIFNSGAIHEQLSSCYLLDSPEDSLKGIYKRYTDVAELSKFAGGIGLPWTRVRSRGSLIEGTNGFSKGVVPWLKTLDSSVSAVDQGGKRKGAACVYLETWHPDIEEFLKLRDNTGDEECRVHHINLANWVPDLFMKRVKEDGIWSLFDPKKVPEFVDLYGEEFERAYEEAERQGLYKKQIKARDLYGRMMKTLGETGNGWITFKDACNLKSNQTGKPDNVIHSSNLCTEIVEVTSQAETAVCNLGSLNLGRYVVDGQFDFEKLGENIRMAIEYLDRVIDRNFYPTPEAEVSNKRQRPVGLGVMGLQDIFFKLRLPFDAPEARELSKKIAEEIYYHALSTSCDLAEKYGIHPSFPETKASKGDLQFDLWGIVPEPIERWNALRERIRKHGLRNSQLIAIAPTATIGSITGAYECIEPQLSNLFKRETLSGEFLQINHYLVEELKKSGLWTGEIRDKIVRAEGSIQGIEELPEELKQIYRTVWEIPMRSLVDMAADRGPFIDQSQSLNLFMENPSIGKLSSMYNYAWKKGLKTTYYLRSRAATRIAKATVTADGQLDPDQTLCSLENPESCEVCQ